MKYQVFVLICTILLTGQPAFGAGREDTRRIVKPKECRTTTYTCILKKVDGVPFFCVRTTKQRYQNARKSLRKVSERQCLRRYPVEYEPVKQTPGMEE